MKNQYFMSYPGNKRNEVNNIESILNIDGISAVVEPYCGSCAISYYLWTKYPNLKYILNDNNQYLKELYDICRDDAKIEKFEKDFNDQMNYIDNDKTRYLEVVKKKDFVSWFIGHKYFNLRPGLFPQGKPMNKTIKINQFPIYNFFRSANIEYTCTDAFEIYNKYKNDDDKIIILDPPYFSSYNDFYYDNSLNIYEYFYNNNIDKEKARIYLVLENSWIIKLLFANNKKHDEYNKQYQTSKKKTSHIIISNQKDEILI